MKAILLLTVLFISHLDKLLQEVERRTKKTHEYATQPLRDVGVAGSMNFTVLAPPDKSPAPIQDYLCEKVLAHAEKVRKNFMPTAKVGENFAHIHVMKSDAYRKPFVLLCGPGHRFSGDHRVWITYVHPSTINKDVAYAVQVLARNWETEESIR